MSRHVRLILIAGLSLLLLNCPSAPKPPQEVAAPEFSPAGGVYTTAQTVTIATTTEGAEIRYTTDGSDPSATTGTAYTVPVQVAATTTLKAIAVRKDWKDSAVVGATYTITGTVADVTFAPAAGTYEESVTVTMATTTSGADVHFTVDGTEPSATAGNLYTEPVKLEATATLKAIATKKDWAPSKVTSAAYEVKPKAVVEVPPPPPPPPPPEEVIPAVTDEEVAAARGALARAREFDAQIYDPEDLNAANAALLQALTIRESDPKASRSALEDSTAKSDLAYQNSVQRMATDLAARMEKAKQALVGVNADKWLSADYQDVTSGIDKANSLFASEDYAGARSAAYEALRNMAALYDRLDDRLIYVRGLRRDVEQLMAQAESADAYRWAPEQKDKVTGLYVKGLDAWADYKLDDAEENFGAAREAARDTLVIASDKRTAAEESSKVKADALQQEAKQAIEGAAGLTIATDQGEVVTPEEWKQFLQDIEELEKQYPPPQSALPRGDGRLLAAVPIPAVGTVVLADEVTSAKDLLNQAKEMYRLGLEARSKGDYDTAQQYFNEALRYVEVYKSFAVKGVYTVRLIPERRDCLWRISEYDFIYGDPWKWPLIWRRNRKLIQNPDLIYPGWQLVIPLQ